MSDQDLFKAFKESSETDRDFDYKSSGWYKVNRLLNYDDQKKKRKFLLFLPWLVAGSMLGFCVFLYQSQSNSNKQIKELITQINKTKTIIKTDTISTIKYIYIHDTIATTKIVYIESAPAKRNELNNNNFSEGNITNATSDEKSTKNTIQNIEDIFTKKDSATILHDDNSVEVNAATKRALMDTAKLEDYTGSNTNDALSKTTGNDSLTVADYKQETIAENKNDSLNNTVANTDIDTSKLASEKKEKDDKHRFKMVTELGAQAGLLLPVEKKMVYQFGYNAGLGYNVYISPNFQLHFRGAYSRLYFETKQPNDNIGVASVPAPNPGAGYVFETATSSFSFLNAELGLNYLLPLKYKFNPLVGISYGGKFFIRQKANYTFYNNINADIVVEAEGSSRSPVWNQLVPSIGFYRSLNDKWNWYFTGFYNWNNSPRTIAPPNYFGLNTSFYYKL